MSSTLSIFKYWEGPITHKIGNTLTDTKTEKTYKQTGRILTYGELPDAPGIYLFRNLADRDNIYCGKAEDLRQRLAQHLNGQSGKLRNGEEYKVRWFVSEKSFFGVSDHGLLEAIAVIYLSPERNDGKDWKSYLRREVPGKILEKAKSLGFYPDDRDEREYFCLRLIEYISKEI